MCLYRGFLSHVSSSRNSSSHGAGEPTEQLVAPKKKVTETYTVSPRFCPKRSWGLSAGPLATLASPGSLALHFNMLGQSPEKLN